MMEKEIVYNELINQGYSERNARLVADELMLVSPELVPCLEAWLNGKNPNYSVEDYSIKGLMAERHMTYPAALLTIDWLIKEPEKAIDSLNKRRK